MAQRATDGEWQKDAVPCCCFCTERVAVSTRGPGLERGAVMRLTASPDHWRRSKYSAPATRRPVKRQTASIGLGVEQARRG